jgi:catalase-peroxidase
MILAALRAGSMGFKTFGFAGGREDVWEPMEEFIGALKRSGWGIALLGERISRTRVSVQMGLIYVNP